MHEIKKFCEERKITRKIQDAFIAYCKASVSDYYQIGSGETVTGILMKFNRKEVEECWMRFISDLKNTLSKENIS